MKTTPAQSLLSTGTRLATALAVVGFVAAAWIGSEHESRHAVQAASLALSTTYVTLPSVVIVAKRERADATAMAASSAARSARVAL